MRNKYRQGLMQLTDEEWKILGLIAQGHTNREIAYKLGCSIKKVEGRLTAIYGQLGVRGRAEATAFYIRHRESIRVAPISLGEPISPYAAEQELQLIYSYYQTGFPSTVLRRSTWLENRVWEALITKYQDITALDLGDDDTLKLANLLAFAICAQGQSHTYLGTKQEGFERKRYIATRLKKLADLTSLPLPYALGQITEGTAYYIRDDHRHALDALSKAWEYRNVLDSLWQSNVLRMMGLSLAAHGDYENAQLKVRQIRALWKHLVAPQGQEERYEYHRYIAIEGIARIEALLRSDNANSTLVELVVGEELERANHLRLMEIRTKLCVMLYLNVLDVEQTQRLAVEAAVIGKPYARHFDTIETKVYQIHRAAGKQPKFRLLS